MPTPPSTPNPVTSQKEKRVREVSNDYTGNQSRLVWVFTCVNAWYLHHRRESDHVYLQLVLICILTQISIMHPCDLKQSLTCKGRRHSPSVPSTIQESCPQDTDSHCLHLPSFFCSLPLNTLIYQFYTLYACFSLYCTGIKCPQTIKSLFFLVPPFH